MSRLSFQTSNLKERAVEPNPRRHPLLRLLIRRHAFAAAATAVVALVAAAVGAGPLAVVAVGFVCDSGVVGVSESLCLVGRSCTSACNRSFPEILRNP